MYKTYLSEYDNVLKNYFQDIRKYNMISSKEEEIELLKRVKKNDQKALDILVKSNLRFVIKVAKKYQGQGVPLKDLISEGNIGLIRAAKKFNFNHNVKFITCAIWWVKQAILQSIYENRSTVRETLNNINDKTQMVKQRDIFYLKNGRYPYGGEDLGDGFIYEEIESVCLSSLNVKSDDFSTELIDDISDDSFNKLDKITDNIFINNEQAHINELFETLNEQEESVVRDRFGLNEGKIELDLTLIAKKHKVSVERIRQIERIAIRKMRSIVLEMKVEF